MRGHRALPSLFGRASRNGMFTPGRLWAVVAVFLVASAAGLTFVPAGHATGKRLLYTGDWTGSREVYSVDPAKPRSIAQLTFGQAASCDPIVDQDCGFAGVIPSPDGRRIAYTTATICRGSRDLFVARADGRARGRLAQTRGCGFSGISWAPDSRRLAYVDDDSLYTINADGSGRRKVGEGTDPQWSPNGRWLAFINKGLFLSRGGRSVLVASNVDEYAWAPNSRWIAIATSTTNPYSAQLDVIHPDGTGRLQLSGSYALSPSWSRDSRFVAWSGPGAVRIADLATGDTRIVGGGSSGPNRWSHRGHLFAFDGEKGISTFDAGTGRITVLTADHGSSLAWAPNDRSIAYLRPGVGQFPSSDLRVVTLSGEMRTVVVASGLAGGSIASVSWTKPVGRQRYRRAVGRVAATVSASELAAPWRIERLAAEGERVAYTTCGHVFVWTPTTGKFVQAEPAASLAPMCTTPKNYVAYEVYNLALGTNRIAFGVRDGNTSQRWILYRAPLSAPSGLEALASGTGLAGCTVAYSGLGDLVAGGDVLFFSRWREDLPPAPCGVANSQQIFRIDPTGCPCEPIASSPGPLIPMDAEGGRLAVVGTNATIVMDPTGLALATIPVQAAAAQLDGAHLVVLLPGELRDYDAASGVLVRAWPLADVPSGGGCGSPHPWACPAIRLELDDAARGLVTYVLDGNVHVIRLADGVDATVAPGTTARFMDEGLVYASGTKIRLVPFELLPVRP